MMELVTLYFLLFTSVTCFKIERSKSKDRVFKKNKEDCQNYDGIWASKTSCWCDLFKKKSFSSLFPNGKARCDSILPIDAFLRIHFADGSQKILQTDVKQFCRTFIRIYIWNTVKEKNDEKGVWIDNTQDMSRLLKFTTQGDMDISLLDVHEWAGQLIYVQLKCNSIFNSQKNIVIKFNGTINYPFDLKQLFNGFTQSPSTLKTTGTTTRHKISSTAVATTTSTSTETTTQHYASSTTVTSITAVAITTVTSIETTSKNYTSTTTKNATANKISSTNNTVVISVCIAVLVFIAVILLVLYILWRRRGKNTKKSTPDIKTDANNAPTNVYALPEVTSYDNATYSEVSRNRYDTALSTTSFSPLNETYTEPSFQEETPCQDGYESLVRHYEELEATPETSNINETKEQYSQLSKVGNDDEYQSIQKSDCDSSATPDDTSFNNEAYDAFNSTGPKSIKSAEPENLYHIIESP